MKPVQCCRVGPQNSRSLILFLPKWLVHRNAALGLDKPTARLFCMTNSSDKEHSSVLTAAPESGVLWRHAAGYSEFRFYKGSFQEERKKKALGQPTQQSYFKRHRKPKQSFLLGFKGNVLHLQHQHPEILSTESSLDNAGSGLFNFQEVKKLPRQQLTGISGSPDLQRIFSRCVLSGYCSAACSDQDRKKQSWWIQHERDSRHLYSWMATEKSLIHRFHRI